MNKTLLWILGLIIITSYVLAQRNDNMFYQSTTSEVQSTDIVLNLPMINTTSNSTYTKDYGNQNNSGAVSGAVYNSSDNSYSFDGVSNPIITMNAAVLTPTAMTVSFWWKRSGNAGGASTTYHHILRYLAGYSASNGNSFYVFSAGDRALFRVSVGGVLKDLTLTGLDTTGWNHIVGIWDGTSSWGYVNGNAISPIEATGILNAGTTPLNIGRAANYVVNGTVDDVLIFNRSLSSSEVAKLYSYGRVPSYPYKGSKDYLLNPPPIIAPQRTNKYFIYDYDDVSYYNIIAPNMLLNLPMRNYSSNTTYTKDYSGNNYDGVVSGITFDNESDTYVFLGSSGYITKRTAMNLSGDFSICAWIYNNLSNASWPTPISLTSDASAQFLWWYTIGANEAIVNVQGNGATISWGSASVASTWAHWCINHNRAASTSELFINSTSKGAQSKTFTTTTTPLISIGAYLGSVGSSYSFKGLVDDVKVFNRSLNQAEVNQLYADGR
jgi:hypothetical protein